jgi:DNA-binding MarR family transcriptional regulator
MSIKASSAVWKLAMPSDGKSTATQKLVLLCLADHADDMGRNCYPSVDTVAAKCSIDRSTVKRALRSLKEAGLIAVVSASRSHRSTGYELTFLGGSVHPKDLGRNAPDLGCNVPDSGATCTDLGCNVHGFGGSLPPEPSLTVQEPSGEPSEEPPGAAGQTSFFDSIWAAVVLELSADIHPLRMETYQHVRLARLQGQTATIRCRRRDIEALRRDQTVLIRAFARAGQTVEAVRVEAA